MLAAVILSVCVLCEKLCGSDTVVTILILFTLGGVNIEKWIPRPTMAHDGRKSSCRTHTMQAIHSMLINIILLILKTFILQNNQNYILQKNQNYITRIFHKVYRTYFTRYHSSSSSSSESSLRESSSSPISSSSSLVSESSESSSSSKSNPKIISSSSCSSPKSSC